MSLLADGNDPAPESIDATQQDYRQARDMMAAPIIGAIETATLPEWFELPIRHRIERVPVLWYRPLVGIVSRADLARHVTAAGEYPGPALSIPMPHWNREP